MNTPKNPHLFLFQPGRWIGEGKISFTGSPDQIRFYTSWEIKPENNKEIRTLQQVNLIGVEESVVNQHHITDITAKTFSISLENDLIGQLNGKGIFDEKSIAWDFKETKEFEGYEIYTLQENGEYHFHAEYISEGSFRSITEGRIWRKS